VVCDGRLAFVNCTQRMLVEGYLALLPAGQTVVEIEENVVPDEASVEACQRLKKSNYQIALDNFVPSDPREPLLAYADFVKIDIRKVSFSESAQLIERHRSPERRAAAVKVQSREEFVEAKHAGFALFQGYFFRRPERMRARQIPGDRATFMRLLQAISKPELDFSEIENLIKHEASLCYRLLRYLNSPLLGLNVPVASVRHALNLLGERELVRWLRMATTLIMGQSRCSDLVLSSLVRARFCELIAAKLEQCKSDLFLLGMLSLMDSILEVPMGVVLEGIAVDPDTKAELLRTDASDKTALTSIYALMLAREAGDWEKVAAQCKRLNLSLAFINRAYNEAITWAHQVSTMSPPAQ
jgi:c-di-GMP-related signal transduction protein